MQKMIARAALAAAVAVLVAVSGWQYARAADTFGSAAGIVADTVRNDPWSGLYVEAGIGMTASNVDLGATGMGTLLTLGDTAWAGHVGIGFDQMVAPHVVLGVLGRAEINDLSYGVMGQSLADTGIEYMVGARAGFVPRSDWMVYALLGYRFADLDLNNALPVGDVSKNGWVVGGGIEAMMTDHVFVGLEYLAALGEGENVGATGVELETTDHSGKLRAGYRF